MLVTLSSILPPFLLFCKSCHEGFVVCDPVTDVASRPGMMHRRGGGERAGDGDAHLDGAPD